MIYSKCGTSNKSKCFCIRIVVCQTRKQRSYLEVPILLALTNHFNYGLGVKSMPI